jgi:hypothetical protein
MREQMSDTKKVFIALPIYGGVHFAFFTSIMKLVQSGINATFDPLPGDSLVSRARNRLVARFLKSDCTHLLFLDSDLQFEPWQIKRLLSHDLDIVCGLYPKKQAELGWVMNIFPEVKDPDASGLLPVKCAGTGAMLISRSTIQRMQDAYPMLRYDADAGAAQGSHWDLFKVGVWPCLEIPRLEFPQKPIDARYDLPAEIPQQLRAMRDESRHNSEDWFFCYLAWNLGIPTFMDMRAGWFNHWDGNTKYPMGKVPVENLSGPSIAQAGQRAAG